MKRESGRIFYVSDMIDYKHLNYYPHAICIIGDVLYKMFKRPEFGLADDGKYNPKTFIGMLSMGRIVGKWYKWYDSPFFSMYLSNNMNYFTTMHAEEIYKKLGKMEINLFNSKIKKLV